MLLNRIKERGIMYTFVCEDSISGVFCGIYEAWAGKFNRDEIRMKAGNVKNYELFMEYKTIDNKLELAQKVANTIIRRFGEETYEMLCYALWSESEDKADAVYRMVRYGLEKKCGYDLKNHLTEPSVQRTFELFRTCYNEAHHYLGFVRFAELESRVLYAEIKPKNYVLEPLAVHFADRIPGENWIIHDSIRRKVVFHRAFGDWLVIDEQSVVNLIQEPWKQSEEEFQQMWKLFCDAISIEARKNLKLQRQNLPLRFRETMVH